ncbi:MAG: hypothetical protein EAY75_17445, partial [Bacteroidetes bacterium]
LGFSQFKNTNSTNSVKTISTTVFGGITPGIYYAIGEKKNWLLTANVGNLGVRYSKGSNNEGWAVNTSLFQSYQFGFAYIF